MVISARAGYWGVTVGQVGGLASTGGNASPESGPDDGRHEADLDGAEAAPAPPELQRLHVDDPAVDLAHALRVFGRGLSTPAVSPAADDHG